MPTQSHANTCAVCNTPRNGANWGWNSSRTVWCPCCKHAYDRYLTDGHPIPEHASGNGLAAHLPAYMLAPEQWPNIGFTPTLLAPYR